MKLISKALRIAPVTWVTVFPATHPHLSTSGMSHPAFNPCCRVLLHFGRYSLPVLQTVGCWVGLGGWLNTEVIYLPEDGHPCSTNQPIVLRPGIEPTTVD